MSDEWERRFQEEILPELSSRFHLSAGSLSVVQHDRNLVYRSSSPMGDVVLKVIRSTQSCDDLLLGELDWIAHLHSNGVRVPRPFASQRGSLVESLVVDGRRFSAYCLQRIQGPLWQECDARRDFISAVGQLAGRMHRVSIGYEPAIPGAMRPTWKDGPWLGSPSDTIHPSMPRIIERCLELRSTLSELPSTDYGIVHDDLHGGNIVISQDGPVPIDFECSHYSWLVSEIASALFFWLWKTPDSEPRELALRATEFLRAFLNGYAEEHSLKPEWIARVPLFLKARELSIFASSRLAAEDFDRHGRCDSTFSWMKSNIENGVPYVRFDPRTLEALALGAGG